MKNENLLMWILGLVVVLFLFGGFGMMGFGGTYGYGGMMSGFGSMWLFGWLFMALVTVALVLFIVWLVKQLQKK
jgi:uncharacterized membrane protein